MQPTTLHPRHTTRELVINWHLTETCNYSCRYCYSSWQHPEQPGEIFRNPELSSRLLGELYRFFRPDNGATPLRGELSWQNVRLSLAGGETLLYPQHTMRIAQDAKSLGFNLSLITNASLLNLQEIPTLASNLSMLGISLDSADPQTNRKIGRVDRSGRILCLDALAEKISLAQACNPNLRIKINTVVNALNANENLTELIERLQPDKWKVLRILPVVTTALAVSDQQFMDFVERHRQLGRVLSVENNQDMTESYLMVDPFGRFFQNRSSMPGKSSYVYSQPLLEIGADAAFAQVNFDVAKFAGRYSTSGKGQAA